MDDYIEIIGPTLMATPAGGLTLKESEAVLWTGEGKDTEETAMILGVSPRTVKARIANSCYKLHANGRAQMIAKAFISGVLHSALAAVMYLFFTFPLNSADVEKMRLARRTHARRRHDEYINLHAPMSGRPPYFTPEIEVA
ncbi:helix-turn-helix transcriptional regulator [Spongiibacter sp. KMU-166]|uniref:Helix-turn-helix transcriptional regulator n=1 Tax=Spongiibacter thalassae TaxID=2721624 RepID=A0ABX1GFT4_9GAMM|nr:helix-turn-helix transcriptional regulator [Spongiibacter thalassae]NKI17408.1 helix-turn-helix transcriptional regulator [Spongiibacter thalassae]